MIADVAALLNSYRTFVMFWFQPPSSSESLRRARTLAKVEPIDATSVKASIRGAMPGGVGGRSIVVMSATERLPLSQLAAVPPSAIVRS